MAKQSERFWLVWNEDGGEPRVKHSSFEGADREARRMAAAHPGASFFVLTAARGYSTVDPVQEIELVDDDMPF